MYIYIHTHIHGDSTKQKNEKFQDLIQKKDGEVGMGIYHGKVVSLEAENNGDPSDGKLVGLATCGKRKRF